MDASFKLTCQEMGAAYDAGRDAVIALVEELVARFTAISEQQQQRITALEQELQELKRTVTTAASRRLGTATNASNRGARARAESAPASALGGSPSILVRP